MVCLLVTFNRKQYYKSFAGCVCCCTEYSLHSVTLAVLKANVSLVELIFNHVINEANTCRCCVLPVMPKPDQWRSSIFLSACAPTKWKACWDRICPPPARSSTRQLSFTTEERSAARRSVSPAGVFSHHLHTLMAFTNQVLPCQKVSKVICLMCSVARLNLEMFTEVEVTTVYCLHFNFILISSVC